MKFRNTIFTGILFFIVFSCKKENIPIVIPHNYIIAGQTDTLKVKYYDINPDKELIADSVGCKAYYGIDSVDLNNDKIYDVGLYYHLNADLNCECPLNGGGCFRLASWNRSLIIKNERLQVCSDSVGNVLPLNYGDTINNNKKWSSSYFQTLYDANSSGNKGYWSFKSDKFVGIRFINTKDTIYGWLKVNIEKTIIIKEYALNK